MFKLSPPVVFQEILAVRGGAKPYYFLDVSTFTTSRLPRDPLSQRWYCVGEKWPKNFAWNARLPRSIQESFTCRKSTTWNRRLYFPSEGRRAEDFFAPKNPTASAGFEPANLGTKGHGDIYFCLYLKVRWRCLKKKRPRLNRVSTRMVQGTGVVRKVQSRDPQNITYKICVVYLA